MRMIAVINGDSGTLRTLDIDAFCGVITGLFADEGKELSCVVAEGRNIASTLDRAFGEDRTQGVIIAGGDGTLSAAAERAWQSGKLLGVLPGGTMNLFARSLGMPMEMTEAAAALAKGVEDRSDIATANGRPFLHQFSVGFQPRMVKLRERQNYRSRLGKLAASAMAALDSIRRPPSYRVDLEIDGKRHSSRLSSLAISNNPFGEGHMPYADAVNTGRLGVYLARPASHATNARMLADMMLGTWRTNPDISEFEAHRVVARFPERKRHASAAIDGELVDLERSIEIDIHPGELKVLRPSG
ncbi:MAG: diacylglycerol kinase family protein [Pseudomonadota bacterium]|nr:diacylglycerol kinase family protein [Pseudomonadota bacterium]